MAPGGPTPEFPLYPSFQNPDRGRPPGLPDRARLSEAAEPPSRQSSPLHSVVNQLSQDGELRTDSRSGASTYACGPRRLPEDRWHSTGPRALLKSYKSHLSLTLLSPEPGRGGSPQTGCVTQRVASDLWRREQSAFFPRTHLHRKVLLSHVHLFETPWT